MSNEKDAGLLKMNTIELLAKKISNQQILFL